MRIIVEKNYLPLYFSQLLNILLLKKIILQITLFYLQIKKSNTKIAVLIYLKNCKSFNSLSANLSNHKMMKRTGNVIRHDDPQIFNEKLNELLRQQMIFAQRNRH